MIGYASYTDSKNVALLEERGWRLLISARWARKKIQRKHLPRLLRMGYAIDNGAWSAHVRGEAFPAEEFEYTVRTYVDRADWTVLPDVVAGGHDSLRFSLDWLGRVPGRVLIAVQDGMTPDDILPHVGGRVGIFVGGSTDWKLSTLRSWGRVAARADCYLHVARVNSRRRVAASKGAGAHSIDGSGVTIFTARDLPWMDGALRQGHFDWGVGDA